MWVARPEAPRRSCCTGRPAPGRRGRRCWRHPICRGAPLTDVIGIDLPGWGESGDIAGVRTVGDVSDAVAEVARALGYSSWRVVGHSLGGFIALDVAARHPDATLGVTLVSATGTGAVDAVRRPLRGGTALPWFAGMLLAMRGLALLGNAGGACPLPRALGDGCRHCRRRCSPAPVHPSVIAALADEVRPSAFARAARLAAEYEVRTWTGISLPGALGARRARRLRRRDGCRRLRRAHPRLQRGATGRRGALRSR